MSQYNDDYDDGPRRYRSTRTRPRERGDPDYVQETTYIERGKGAPPRDLVYRNRDDSVEDIPRDFPPPGDDRYRRSRGYNDDYAPPRRARSVGRRDYDDYDHDYAGAAAAGAAGGYAAGRARDRRGGERRRRDRRDRDYDSEDYESPRRHRERRKSGVGEVLEGLGLGGVAAALSGGKDRSRSRSKSRDRRGSSRRRRDYSSSSSDRSRSRGGGGKTERKWAQAAQAALVAGAVEAFRSRKDPGPWTGEKGRRIATAALGAGGIDGLVDRDPDKKSKRHLAEAVIGGLAANRLANGARPGKRDYSPGGRSRSRSNSIFGRGRSSSRGGGGGGRGGAAKELLAGGALAAAGKAIYDRVRSKSRRRRSPSSSSADSYVPSRNRRRDNRRRSPTSDTTNRDGPADRGRTRDGPGGGGGGGNALAAGGAGAGAGALAGGANSRSSSTDSSSTTDMENKRKHMRGKELLTAGLATIATIHAAHGVYTSMEAHEKRHRLVQEGEMTPEEARKKQTKAWVQDAAAVGIAALGIKGAFSEWKEMNEHRSVTFQVHHRKRGLFTNTRSQTRNPRT